MQRKTAVRMKKIEEECKAERMSIDTMESMTQSINDEFVRVREFIAKRISTMNHNHSKKICNQL